MKRGVVLVALLLVGSISVAVMGFQGPPAGQGAPPRGGAPGWSSGRTAWTGSSRPLTPSKFGTTFS